MKTFVSFEGKVGKYIQQHNMLQKGDEVIVAVSGGADSVCLLHYMHTHQKELEIRVSAAHFNHGMREKASDEDADFVVNLCQKYGVKLALGKGNMSTTAKPQGLGVEEWARELRYAFFGGLLALPNVKVATAHTLSDNAETVLFNLARGSGTRGLAGIPRVRGSFFRPLLCVSRREVEEYCARNSLSFVHDETNDSLIYSRNRLRHKVLPQLEKVHSGALVAIGRMANDMRELDTWLQESAVQLLLEAKTLGGYKTCVLLAAPRPVRMHALSALAPQKSSHAVLERLDEMLAENKSKQNLPKGYWAIVNNGIICIAKLQTKDLAPAYEFPLEQGGLWRLHGGYTVEATIQKAENMAKTETIDTNPHEFYADYDKLDEACVFRTRRTGDNFTFERRGITKSVKKWMNEEKIPNAQRESWPILASGNRVLWIYGFGFCKGLAVDARTKRVLALRAIQNEE